MLVENRACRRAGQADGQSDKQKWLADKQPKQMFIENQARRQTNTHTHRQTFRENQARRHRQKCNREVRSVHWKHTPCWPLWTVPANRRVCRIHTKSRIQEATARPLAGPLQAATIIATPGHHSHRRPIDCKFRNWIIWIIWVESERPIAIEPDSINYCPTHRPTDRPTGRWWTIETNICTPNTYTNPNTIYREYW